MSSRIEKIAYVVYRETMITSTGNLEISGFRYLLYSASQHKCPARKAASPPEKNTGLSGFNKRKSPVIPNNNAHKTAGEGDDTSQIQSSNKGINAGFVIRRTDSCWIKQAVRCTAAHKQKTIPATAGSPENKALNSI